MFRVRWLVAWVALLPWLSSTPASAADDDWQARAEGARDARVPGERERRRPPGAEPRAGSAHLLRRARHPRARPHGAGQPRALALTLSRVGRGKALARIPAGEISHEGARVEIRHPRVLEWYDNSDAGLEQASPWRSARRAAARSCSSSSSRTQNELHHWRARVQYAEATGPLPAHPAHGPWRREQAQSVEADIRTIPEPGVIASLASGVALLAALARNRRATR